MSIKRGLVPAFMAALCMFIAQGSLEAASSPNNQEQAIYRGAEQTATPAASAHFTGQAYVEGAFSQQGDRPYAAAYVSFEPGARTAWHYHPLGQTLLIVRGECWTQTKDGKKIAARIGDVVWCPPNVVHYHGASSNSVMTHLAIAEKREGVPSVVWLEKVSDQEYMQDENIKP